jgi:D-inositol-3-phosphate glycosyltransferase
LKVSLLTGCADKPYALGLLEALLAHGLQIDVIGGDDIRTSELMARPGVRFFNLRGDQDPHVSWIRKSARILAYYSRLLRYAAKADPKLFHILWLDRFPWLDRTLILGYYRLLRKKIVFTAHNIDDRARDGGDSVLNRASLRALYAQVDHVFVHSAKMRDELTARFPTPADKVSVIPFGINNTLPNSGLTAAEAKARLGLNAGEKAILFFGNIAPYKGLDDALSALGMLTEVDPAVRLIIAGPIKGSGEHWAEIERKTRSRGLERFVVARIGYVPDHDVEIYFKAADVLVLPYRFIYQSGVLFLAYSFGLPVIASDVGSLREAIVEGRTGAVCRPEDPKDLADKIEAYFRGELFAHLESRRPEIQDFGNRTFSWDTVAAITCRVYDRLAGPTPRRP